MTIETATLASGLAVEQPPTIIDTEVPGLSYAVSSTEHGPRVAAVDYRTELEDHAPLRRTGTRIVAELDSLFEEVSRRPLFEHSTLWASPSANVVTVIYDDHTNEQARHREDRLTLSLTADEDWLAWHELSGRYLGQEEFGDAIEELLHSVVSPDHADLMEIIESIRVSTGSQFESGIRRSDGAQTLSYREDQTTSAGRSRDLEVPQTIRLKLRPFAGIPQWYELDAWFRIRVVSGQLRLAIKLKPTRPILEAAWDDLRASIGSKLERPVLLTP